MKKLFDRLFPKKQPETVEEIIKLFETISIKLAAHEKRSGDAHGHHARQMEFHANQLARTQRILGRMKALTE